jgi:hypothetical protein
MTLMLPNFSTEVIHVVIVLPIHVTQPYRVRKAYFYVGRRCHLRAVTGEQRCKRLLIKAPQEISSLLGLRAVFCSASTNLDRNSMSLDLFCEVLQTVSIVSSDTSIPPTCNPEAFVEPSHPPGLVQIHKPIQETEEDSLLLY